MTTPSSEEELRRILVKLDQGGYLDDNGVDGAIKDILTWHNKQIKAKDIVITSLKSQLYESQADLNENLDTLRNLKKALEDL